MTIVTVASKLPQNIRFGDIVIWGNLRIPPGEKSEHKQIGSFTLTPDVPAAVWNEWLKHNKSSHMVVSGLIFADNDTEAWSRLHARTTPLTFGEVPYVSPRGV